MVKHLGGVEARPHPPLTTRWDYQDLPEGGPRFELLSGEIAMAPSPNRRHQQIALNIAAALKGFLGKHPLGTVYIAPLDVYLSDLSVVQPDVFFIASGHQGRLRDYGIEGAPQLVVEILSPRNPKQDKVIKKALYYRHGVSEYWIIDPDGDLVEIYQLKDDPVEPVRTLQREDALATPLLPGLSLSLEEVFRD